MNRPVFALIDCDNFFVSCERLFRPDLATWPVVVLSSNDGCAVARSNEAKMLGIPMGAPAFKYRQLFEKHHVIKFSANFELYADISKRIIHILTELTSRIEVYSIDESFLDLSQLDIKDYDQWGKTLRNRIMKEVGVPVSIGIAPSKTLAKLASERAKKDSARQGTISLIDCDEPTLVAHRTGMSVQDVWGIGWRLAPKLRSYGIGTANDVARMPPRLAQSLMGIHGRQLVYELNGTCCLPLEVIGQKPKSISRGRTFGEDTQELHVLEAAIANFTAQAAFRLRSSHQLACKAGVFLMTNKHKPSYHRRHHEVVFQTPTADTGLLLTTLIDSLKNLYSPQLQYHRAGIWLRDFSPDNRIQTDLLGGVSLSDCHRSTKRMQTLDAINAHYGKRTLRYAAEDLARSWQPKQILRSPQYTSNWEDLPVATIQS